MNFLTVTVLHNDHVVDQPLSDLAPVTADGTEEVMKILQKSPAKQCKLDPIVLYPFGLSSVPVMSWLQSLLQCVVTHCSSNSCFHAAIRTPLSNHWALKSCSMYLNDLASYRPISNVSFFQRLSRKWSIATVGANQQTLPATNLPVSLTPVPFDVDSCGQHTWWHGFVIVGTVTTSQGVDDQGHIGAVVKFDLSATIDTVGHSILIYGHCACWSVGLAVEVERSSKKWTRAKSVVLCHVDWPILMQSVSVQTETWPCRRRQHRRAWDVDIATRHLAVQMHVTVTSMSSLLCHSNDDVFICTAPWRSRLPCVTSSFQADTDVAIIDIIGMRSRQPPGTATSWPSVDKDAVVCQVTLAQTSGNSHCVTTFCIECQLRHLPCFACWCRYSSRGLDLSNPVFQLDHVVQRDCVILHLCALCREATWCRVTKCKESYVHPSKNDVSRGC